MPSRWVGDKDGISSTSLGVFAAYVATAILSISLSTPVSALQTVPDSPCAAACTEGDLNYQNNTVCLDEDYQTGGGQRFRECTTCLLNSTAVDTASNVSDVYWGLFNIRYTLSECMFAYPAEIVSISSPCQVSCQPLANATAYGIGTDAATATDNTVPNLDFCTHGFEQENKINNCSFCYSFIPQQLFMANFLQALHIACRQPPPIGDTFYPDGRAIFNESAIPGPAPLGSGVQPHSGLTGWKLGLIVALPVIGGVLIFGLSCFCCFRFTKKRRVRMAATGRMSKFHDTHSPHLAGGLSMSHGKEPSDYDWPIGRDDSAQEMERISHVHTPKGHGKQPSPGLAQGRWSQHERDDESDVPLSALPREDVGPGQGQARDPFLHDQYFGVASSGIPGESLAGPSQSFAHPEERGSWARQ